MSELISMNLSLAADLNVTSSEVVLSLLIEAFKISPSKDKEIVWQMNTIVSPAVVGSDKSRPQLPLVVELAK